MLFKNVSIHTIAHLEAPIRVTSAEISARLSKTFERIRVPQNIVEKMTGIQERRFWKENQTTSSIATIVADAVIAKSGLLKNDIGAIISTSISKDYIEPSMASIIHGNLKLPAKCMNFDLGNACLGFLNGIHIAATMVESNHASHVLVVAAESAHEGVAATLQRLERDTATRQEVREQLATLTLGSGAVAMIISRSALAPKGHRILGLISQAATEHNNLCMATSERMLTDAPKILNEGMSLTLKLFKDAELNLGLKSFRVDEYAIHQISKAHVQMFLKLLNIESSKVMTTFQEYGNMGPVSLPFIISKLEMTGRLVSGKQLVMVGAGSGLNGMIMTVQW